MSKPSDKKRYDTSGRDFNATLDYPDYTVAGGTQAIAQLEELIEKNDPARPPLPGTYKALADQYMFRFYAEHNPQDLDAAVKANQESVTMVPPEDPLHAIFLQNVAVTLQERLAIKETAEDYNAAIQSLQEAIRLTPEWNSTRASFLKDLADIFWTRYQSWQDLKDLAATLQNFKEAADISAFDSQLKEMRAECLDGLGKAWRARFTRLRDLKDLDTAQQKLKESVALTPDSDPTKPARLQTLAEILGDRYKWQKKPKDIHAAIENHRKAIKLTPEDDPGRAITLEAAVQTYLERYEALGDQKDLDIALELYHESMELIPPDDSNIGLFHGQLAELLLARYKKSGNLNDLEVSLQMYQEIVDSMDETHRDKLMLMSALSHCFESRFDKTGDLRDLESSIQICQEVVDKMLPQNTSAADYLNALASALAERYERTKNPADLDAVNMYYAASLKGTIKPEAAWTQATYWASFLNKFQPSNLPTAYEAAFNLLPDIMWIGNSISVRHEAIRRIDIGKVTSTATKSCIDSLLFTSAIQILEQGLATVFQQILQLKPDVTGVDPLKAERLKQISVELYSSSAKGLELVIERDELLEDIRKEHTYFLRPKPYEILRQAAQGGPVIILNSHEKGCDALIILNPTSEPLHIPLPNLTSDLLKSQRGVLKILLQKCNIGIRGGGSTSSKIFDVLKSHGASLKDHLKPKFSARGTRLDAHQEGPMIVSTQQAFADMLNWLWTEIVRPVYQVLETHGIQGGRLWWLPTGEFSGLPLHASPPTAQFIHSYTATLGSLLEAHAKKSAATGSQPKTFGIVGVTQTGPLKKQYLQGVREEVEKIISVVGESNVNKLEGKDATVNAVMTQLQQCPWIHLACHGTQDPVDPTKSRLLLYRGNLELNTILEKPLPNAQFVFLAACQSAMGDAELVNESFHLGGGFIAAGFRSAVGTLWSMNDEDGPLVAELVYSHLVRDGKEPEVYDTAEALQLAVAELKARKDVPYERWIPFIHLGI
ncbi:CHAT domain-containing protein [Roridomyces roridus]|uniref:CHAT domain-containing protein n=1 Tax=Roridomyces roridus TaxID=1738132 RepID=A0AAD7FLG4_9AGAR|nr:CHAT domain-containing protein [Roridomyces roridus]